MREAEAAARALSQAQEEATMKLETWRAQLAGPAAQALLEYTRMERELDLQFAAGELSADQYADAMGMVAQMRKQDAALLPDYTHAIAEAARAQEEAARIADSVAFAAEDMFASFIDGSKSAEEAFGDFAKSLQRIAAQMLAEKAVQWLFGMFTGTGGGGDFVWGARDFTGFASGGYTGPGGKHEPAGIVHKGEVVWSQADVRRAGGVGVVESMRLRGYAAGGVVGAAPMGGGIRDVVIHNHGGSVETEERPAGDGTGMSDLIVRFKAIARSAIGEDLAHGTGIAKIGQQAYGWTRQAVTRG